MDLDRSIQILSDIVIFTKYAKHLESEQRRETWTEIVTRVRDMHVNKFPGIKEDIHKAYQFVFDKKVLPSMRTMQFGGSPIEKNNSRSYNCSFIAIQSPKDFSEIMFLLLAGTGVGFSVQRRHINLLPTITIPKKGKRFLISDSIEGWADAVRALFRSYLQSGSMPLFDYSDIRPKGAILKTSGGKAPGPEPLKRALNKIEAMLAMKIPGDRLTPIEVHDAVCHLADAVLAGGIRRSACISIFDADDEEMVNAKGYLPVTVYNGGFHLNPQTKMYEGDVLYRGKAHHIILTDKEFQKFQEFHSIAWYYLEPQRARSNNSAVLFREDMPELGIKASTREDFQRIWDICKSSGAGEPGVLWTNHPDWGTNPCVTGDTKVAVADGRGEVSIKELAMEAKDVLVYCLGNEGKLDIRWMRAPRMTGEKMAVYKIILDDGSVIRATENHKFILRDGNEVEVKDMKYGDSLWVMHWANGELSEEEYRMKQSEWTGYTNEDLKEHALILTRKLERQFLTIEWTDYAIPLGLPTMFSGWRVTHLGGIRGLAKWAALELGYTSTDGVDTGTIKRYYKLLGQGYNCDIVDGNIVFHKICEVSGQAFDTLRSEHSIIADIRRKSPFRQWENLKGAEQQYNHHVVSVEFDGYEDVYNGTVDEFHNFFVGGFECESTKENPGKTYIATRNCGEIALKSRQMCNLSTINLTTVVDQDDLLERIWAATFIGTIQASYTDFHYLSSRWETQMEEDALLGVSFTGIADVDYTQFNWEEASRHAVSVNKYVSGLIGIRPAARLGTVKPEGTSSSVLGTASGIHGRFADYYIRRIRFNKNESIAQYLTIYHPELIEDEIGNPNNIVVSIPQKSPKGSIVRTESPIHTLERIKWFHEKWIQPTHQYGDNTHNVSCTVNVKPGEWAKVGNWMWENRKYYNGIAVFPWDGGNYTQPPFEEIDEETYNTMYAALTELKLERVVEIMDETNLRGELACSGGSCEVV